MEYLILRQIRDQADLTYLNVPSLNCFVSHYCDVLSERSPAGRWSRRLPPVSIPHQFDTDAAATIVVFCNAAIHFAQTNVN